MTWCPETTGGKPALHIAYTELPGESPLGLRPGSEAILTVWPVTPGVNPTILNTSLPKVELYE